MLRPFLFPVVMTLAFTLIHLIFSRSKGIPAGEHPEFRVPKGLRIFLWIMVFAGVAGFLYLVFGTRPSQRMSGFLMAGGMAIFGCVCCVWADRYVVKFWDDHLTFGAFKMSRIDYKDIISAKARPGGQGTTFLYVKTSKKTFSISGNIASFDGAVRLLDSKLNEVERLHSTPRRTRDDI